MKLLDWFRPGHTDDRPHTATQNIYHCTVQKCASQWLRGILSDPRIQRVSGLTAHQYQGSMPGGFDARPLTQRCFAEPFPHGAIVTPLYIDYGGYASIPKPEHYKTFFVMRDPRDVVTSWYFSAKCSHRPVGDLERIRRVLNLLPKADGLNFVIEHLDAFGLFEAQRSWADAPTHDASVLLLRYEDLIGRNQLAQFKRLLEHCEIPLGTRDLQDLLHAHSFQNLSGRARGREDQGAHLRKGVAGDWRNHFDARVEATLQQVADDVLERWGYH